MKLNHSIDQILLTNGSTKSKFKSIMLIEAKMIKETEEKFTIAEDLSIKTGSSP